MYEEKRTEPIVYQIKRLKVNIIKAIIKDDIPNKKDDIPDAKIDVLNAEDKVLEDLSFEDVLFAGGILFNTISF